MKTSILVDGIKYIPETEAVKNNPAETLDGLEYVIVRTHSAGVFAGYIKSREGQEVVLLDARRLWQWYGAASLSQLSVDGVKDKERCKFPCEVARITLLEAIEITPCTQKAKDSIAEVPIWTA